MSHVVQVTDFGRGGGGLEDPLQPMIPGKIINYHGWMSTCRPEWQGSAHANGMHMAE